MSRTGTTENSTPLITQQPHTGRRTCALNTKSTATAATLQETAKSLLKFSAV